MVESYFIIGLIWAIIIAILHIAIYKSYVKKNFYAYVLVFFMINIFIWPFSIILLLWYFIANV